MRWRRGLSEPGNTPFSDAPQPYAAIVKTLGSEAYAEDDVVRASHPWRVGSLEEALGNTKVLEIHSRSFPRPIERSHYERVYESAITLSKGLNQLL